VPAETNSLRRSAPVMRRHSASRKAAPHGQTTIAIVGWIDGSRPNKSPPQNQNRPIRKATHNRTTCVPTCPSLAKAGNTRLGYVEWNWRAVSENVKATATYPSPGFLVITVVRANGTKALRNAKKTLRIAESRIAPGFSSHRPASNQLGK